MLKKVVAALITAGVVTSLLTVPILAANGKGVQASGKRPGWGYGDSNHSHTGPPGQGDNERPGWGYGDINHNHTGPPM